MTKSTQASDTSRWAPWWLYLIVLAGANYLRSHLLPMQDSPTVMVVAIAGGQAALLFFVVTALWRALHPSPERGQRR